MGIDWKPRNFQKRGVQFLVSRPSAGLFAEPGLGKTSIVLAAFKLLRKRGALKNKKMLVIAPLSVVYNVWPDEVKKWRDFEDLRVVILHGSKKEKALEQEGDVYVINPEGLGWLFSSKHRNWQVPSVLVIDESTKFKSGTTQRFRLLRGLLGRFQRRIILTGTPIPNGYLDLFGQIYILDLGDALGRFITHYRNEFFTAAGFMGYDWRLLPGAQEEIEKRIAPLVLIMRSADYLDLPKRTTVPVPVTLPAKARKQYNELETQFFLRLDDGEIRAFNAGAQSIKLRQLTGGAIYDTDRTAHLIHTEKLERLADLIEEIGHPVIVVYEFRHEYERIVQRFPGAPTLTGATGAQRTRIVSDWNKAKTPVLCMHPESGGHGLNLQAGGHHMVFFTPTWNLEHADQVAKRIDRPGQKHPTFMYHIIAKDTIDEVVLEAQDLKDRTQKSLFTALKRYRDRRRGVNG